MRSPDSSDEEVRWLCTDAITDLQFRESNARSGFFGKKRNVYMYLFPGHFVLWELESARITIENLSLQDDKDF